MALSLVKRALIGRPLPTYRLAHERLNKIQGLAVFASDNLSSSAYATEEILLALTAAGAAALTLAWPIALAITAVFAIVGFSYYQTIQAYPSGGGAYIVARSNLGVWPGLVAAAATYFFVVLMFGMLGLGLWKSAGAPPVPPRLPAAAVGALPPITLMLLLRAFASGSAAMTGVEAISNGVQAFRPPESRNAGITLIWMVAILSSMFLGITFLARHFGIVPGEHETVVSQLARTVFGSATVPYYLLQTGTALILILAANTSFADFPRLSSILARDRFLPHQLSNLGDRLVFVNGIVVLALLSGFLLYVFQASTHRLIPLYAVGVFLSFTLSQSGMVKKWWTERGRGWQRSLVFNLVGAVTTAVILVVVAGAKFVHGAWIIAVLVPTLIWFMRSIHLHYQDVARQLSLEGARIPAGTLQHKVVVPVAGINRGVLPALRYAKSLSDHVTAVMVDVDPRDTAEAQAKWERWGMGVPLKVLASPYRSVLGPFLRYLDELEWEVGFDQQLTVVLPEFVPSRWWHFPLHNQTAFLLKLVLYFRRRQGTRVTVVTDVPYYLAEHQAAEALRGEAAPARIDRVLVAVGMLLLASIAGFVAASMLGWGPLAQGSFGIGALVLLVLSVGLLFLRTLNV